MIALPYLSALHFSGADAGDFLHNQLSADVLALAEGESTFACYCEPKGRVLALLLVSRQADDYVVVVSASLRVPVANRLRMYVLRAKVTIDVLENCVLTASSTADKSPPPAPPAVAINVPGSPAVLSLWRDSTPAVDSTGTDAWKVEELRHGIVWLCPETSGQFLPQMLGFDQLGAVNFRKGCYPGQEIVARTHYLGKVKRHPRLLCTPAVICPEPLDKINLLGNKQSYEAVIVDCGHDTDDGGCLFVVSRMDPELPVEQIEYHGQIAPLKQNPA